MDRVLNQKLREARIRCAVDVLLAQLVCVGLGAGVAGLIAILVQRLLGVTVLVDWAIYSYIGIAVGVVLILWFINCPKRLQVSLLLDERLGLHERLSTVLRLTATDDPFAACALEETQAVIQGIQPKRCIPIRLHRAWRVTLGMWVVCVITFYAVPQKDFLGVIREKQQARQKEVQAQTAKEKIAKVTASAKLMAEQLEDPNVTAQLDDLAEALKQADPKVAKRQAIRQLGNLAETLKQKRDSLDYQAMHQMQTMLRQLRGAKGSIKEELRMALARGDLSKAVSLIKSLQQQMNQGEMSQAQQEAMQKQLESLAQELTTMAQNMAQQQPGAGQNQEFSPEALNMASQMIAGLGQALAQGAGQMNPDNLAEIMSQLQAMQGMMAQVQMSEAMLAALAQNIQNLGAGMLNSGQFGFGQGQGRGPGRGQQKGEGIGTGAAGSYTQSEAPNVQVKQVRAASKVGQGPVIASWYFQGEQTKGEAAMPMQEVIESARVQVSQAVKDHRIPQKYEATVKAYFGQLESQGTDNPEANPEASTE